MARSLLIWWTNQLERPPVLSVTSETVNLPAQGAPSRPVRPDAAPDGFSALIDSNAAESRTNDQPTPAAPDRPSAQPRPADASAPPDRQPTQSAASTQTVESSEAPAPRDPATDTAAKSSKPGKAVSAKTAEAPSDIAAATSPVAPSDAAASTSAAATATAPIPVAVGIAAPIVVVDPVRAPVPSTAQPLAIAAAAIATTTSTIEAAKPAATPAQTPVDAAANERAASTATAAPSTAIPVTAVSDPVGSGATAVSDTVGSGATVADATRPIVNDPVTAPVDQPAAKPDATMQAAPALASAAGATPAAVIAPKVVAKATGTARSSDNATPIEAVGPADDGEQFSAPAEPDAGSKRIAPQAPAPARNGLVEDTAKAEAGKQDLASGTGAPATAHERHAPAPLLLQADTADASQIAGTVAQPAQPAANSAPVPQLSVIASNTAAVPLNGLALQIAVTAQSGRSRFEIRLDPAELGRIDVRIDLDSHGQITSHLTVEKPETLAMLRQDAPQLQRALDNAGFKTSDGGLQFSLRDQSWSGQNGGHETGRNAQRLIISEADVVPVTIAGRTYGRAPGSGGGVDIRV
jgi:flagellar hook-length control protein FliK